MVGKILGAVVGKILGESTVAVVIAASGASEAAGTSADSSSIGTCQYESLTAGTLTTLQAAKTIVPEASASPERALNRRRRTGCSNSQYEPSVSTQVVLSSAVTSSEPRS